MNVTRADRHRLEAIVLDRSAPQKHVWRANIILARPNDIFADRANRSRWYGDGRPAQGPAQAHRIRSTTGTPRIGVCAVCAVK